MTPREFYAQAPKAELRFCPICDGKVLTLNGRFDRYGLPVQSMRCQCGLVFLNPRMTAEAYAEFYRDGHYRALLSEFYERPVTPATIEADQAEYARKLAQWLGPHVDPYSSGLLLDVGGSTGVVADVLAHEFDMDATVIEPSQAEAQKAVSRGLTVENVPMEQFDGQGVHYDLILLCQTVDHLTDPVGALERIRAWIRAEGLFYLDFVECAPIKVDHPIYLSRDTVRGLLHRTGFVVKALEPAGDGLHVKVLAAPV